ncbi:hypothetical protein ACH4PU_32855 [Streptomyces sp. NPDC021100]|uniref:hypothetical protein n=1 Tax=Streptomyces sp. NPDC021100 TaxID=3365114 RepID=UPI0037AA5575
MPGAAGHLAHVLLADPAFMGEPAAAWAEMAAGPGGAAAASRLLEAIAARTPGTGGPLPPVRGTGGDRGGLWRAALAADLPPGALAAPSPSPRSPAISGCPSPGRAPTTLRPWPTLTSSPNAPPAARATKTP